MVEAADFASKYCQLLEIPYKDSLVIKEIASSEELRELVGEITSSCLIALVIHLYSKARGLKVSLGQIQKVCNISYTSISRGMKKLDGRFKEDITLFLQQQQQRQQQ